MKKVTIERHGDTIVAKEGGRTVVKKIGSKISGVAYDPMEDGGKGKFGASKGFLKPVFRKGDKAQQIGTERAIRDITEQLIEDGKGHYVNDAFYGNKRRGNTAEREQEVSKERLEELVG